MNARKLREHTTDIGLEDEMIILIRLGLHQVDVHRGASAGTALLLLHPLASRVLDRRPLLVVKFQYAWYVLGSALVLLLLPIDDLGGVVPVVLREMILGLLGHHEFPGRECA